MLCHVENNISIKLALTEAELEEVYRFRYRVYVDEMNRNQTFADHENRRIADPLDKAAYNFVATRAGMILGIVRVNFCREIDIGYYNELYATHIVGREHPSMTSISTRLMIRPELRGSTLAVRLCLSAYSHAFESGIEHNFIDCNDHLVPFFKGLGYIAHVPKVEHPEYGLVNPMRLKLTDEAHLVKMRSPFLPIFKRMRSRQAATAVVAK
jgi:predicted GNAT family N-acyltransferase